MIMFNDLLDFFKLLKDFIPMFRQKNSDDVNTKIYKVLSPIYATLIDKNDLLQFNHGPHASDEALADTKDCFDYYSRLLKKNNALLNNRQIKAFSRTMSLILHLQKTLNDLRYGGDLTGPEYQDLLKKASPLRKKINHNLNKCRKIMRTLS
ncbi:hypothetical protein FAM7821_00736 [Lacticaseibacillus paracasei]|uniref:hypothetical protein n=1 Tax=Lacticaseibacillus paracasei TaxID=1597 RepID=UPI000FF11948|nr:hypothetical protein [Lacticaseibacillus paracasei]RNE39962.1 hypothetical protein FAM7821_00736 [Lacticaseibacillus paracasei]